MRRNKKKRKKGQKTKKWGKDFVAKIHLKSINSKLAVENHKEKKKEGAKNNKKTLKVLCGQNSSRSSLWKITNRKNKKTAR